MQERGRFADGGLFGDRSWDIAGYRVSDRSTDVVRCHALTNQQS